MRPPTTIKAQKQAAQILAEATEGVIVLDSEWRYLLVNKQAEQLLQIAAAPLLGKNLLREFPERLGDNFYDACLKASQQQCIVETKASASATQPKLAIRICPAPSGICIFLHIDISAPPLPHVGEHATAATLQSLHALTERLTENLDPPSIARNVAQLCVTNLGVKLAWIGKAQADGSIDTLTYYPPDSSYPTQVGLRWDEHPTGQGATGRAIRSGKPVIVPDLTSDIHFWPWRKAAVEAKFQCSAAIPLIAHGHTFGCLNLYSEQAGFFTAQRVSIFQMVAQHSAAALANAQLYTELQEHATELEARVAKRTAELSAANRELQTTNSELETFNYTVSRDLCAIRIIATTLLEDHGQQLDANLRDNLLRIAAAAERGDKLLQDLISFNLLSHTEAELRPLKLGNSVRAALDQLDKSHQECVEITGPLPIVLADASMLKLALFHLLDNALKFIAPATKPKVRIHATVQGGAARIWVEDNGIGIAPANHDKIFRLFERLQGGHTGTGVGLATVKKAAERMGASIGLESEEGKGSRFYIELPLPPKISKS